MNSIEDASVVSPEASTPFLDLGTFESPLLRTGTIRRRYCVVTRG